MSKLRKNEKIKHMHVTPLSGNWSSSHVIYAFTNEGRILQRFSGLTNWNDLTPEREDA